MELHLPPAAQTVAFILRSLLRGHVTALATEIGSRNEDAPEALARAAEYIADHLPTSAQLRRDSFRGRSIDVANIEATFGVAGPGGPVIVIGAHYDSADTGPAANDNGSGVAALLALARRYADSPHPANVEVRFVAFTNEEPPSFQQRTMGSLVYARACRRASDNVVAMVSLETMGYFDTTPGSQSYPVPILSLMYPTRGDFIAFVGNVASRSLTRDLVRSFREHARFPSEGAALPSALPGVGWSDHWSFWQAGYPAVMITDTAPFRYPHYHLRTDTAERIDYDRLARVTGGLGRVIAALVATLASSPTR